VEKSYKNLDHTADVGLEAWGPSREALFSNISKGLSDLIVEVDRVVPKREVEWAVDADSPEELLVKQLEEILYRLDKEGMVFSDFQISLRGLNAIKCLAYGEKLDRERHGFKTEIKAVTYHQIYLGEDNGEWKARVIFDV
jgi:SHS2 domain-containing protein